MECKLAFVADAANDSKGKLNVLGIFDQLTPREYPYLHPQMYLVLAFKATPAEFGRKKNFEIALLDPDGKPLTTLKVSAKVPKPDAGKTANLQIVLQMVNTPFPKPGPYEIGVLVGGDQKATIPIEAVEPPKQSTRKGRKKNAD